MENRGAKKWVAESISHPEEESKFETINNDDQAIVS